MKIYHSYFSTKGHEHLTESMYNTCHLSVLTALKTYGNITLICNKECARMFDGIPYTTIEFFEEAIPYTEEQMFAIGKIFAYKQIAKKGEPFIHIDFDVFLFKILPQNILDSDLFVQSIEYSDYVNFQYGLETFKCKKKYFLNVDLSKYNAYNVGIIGSNNPVSTIKIWDAMLEIIKDPENKDYFTNMLVNEQYFMKSIIIEQLGLYIYCQANNILVKTLFEGDMTELKAKELGYTHLLSEKNNQFINKIIKDKVKKITMGN